MNDLTLSVTGIALRFVLGGSAVAASYILSRIIGGKWSGIFAAFPAVYIAAVVTVSAERALAEGLPLAIAVSKGALVGMISNIVCSVAAAFFIPRTGWQKGLALALLIWFLSVTVVYTLLSVTGLMR